MENQREMKEIIEILKAAYHWGRDNGEGRSDKNFNDFLNTSVVSNLEPLINQEVEKRIADKMVSERSREELARFWAYQNAMGVGDDIYSFIETYLNERR